jgi:hypothetical protein
MQDKPVISNKEIGKWKLGAREYKILSLSLVLNFLFIGVLFKTEALNTKGCDTTVGSVICSLVNAALVAGKIVGTDAGLVDKEYVKTILDDSDLSLASNEGFEPLRYPDGYFILARLQTDKPLDEKSLEENKTEDKKSRETKLEKSDDKGSDEVEDSLDEPIIGSLSDEGAEKELVTDPVTGAEINRKVLRDYANYVKARVDSESVDLEGAFTIVAEGVLNEKGRLDTSRDPRTGKPKSRIIRSQGAEDMTQVAKEAIAAVGDSGWLIYLRKQGIEKINFSVMQDGSEVRIRITSEQPTPENARTIASGLRGIIQGALLLDKNNVKKLGADEKVLLNSAKTSVNRRQFVLDFVMSKAVAQEMIKRRLKEMDGGKGRPSGLAESKSLHRNLSE